MTRPNFWMVTAIAIAWLTLGAQALPESAAERVPSIAAISREVSSDQGTAEEGSPDERGKTHRTAEVDAMPRSDVLRILVDSGRCVGMTKAEAEAEMEKALTQQRAERLRQLAWDFARVRLGSAEVVLEWAWLLQHPGVTEQVIEDLCESRDYGWMAERQVVIHLPYQVLINWTSRLQDRGIQRWQTRLLAAAGTLLIAILAIGVAVVLDHRTGGYYRGVIVVGVFVTMGLLGAAYWIGLLWKMI